MKKQTDESKPRKKPTKDSMEKIVRDLVESVIVTNLFPNKSKDVAELDSAQLLHLKNRARRLLAGTNTSQKR